MLYKTSSPEHKPSAGILTDLIRKYGANSEEVNSYMARFSEDTAFCKKAAMLLTISRQVDSFKKLDHPAEEPPAEKKD